MASPQDGDTGSSPETTKEVLNKQLETYHKLAGMDFSAAELAMAVQHGMKYSVPIHGKLKSSQSLDFKKPSPLTVMSWKASDVWQDEQSLAQGPHAGNLSSEPSQSASGTASHPSGPSEPPPYSAPASHEDEISLTGTPVDIFRLMRQALQSSNERRKPKVAPVTPEGLPLPVGKLLRTQKARGIYALATSRLSLFRSFNTVRPINDRKLWFFPHEEPPIDAFPLFARPCPTRPRHGFVESRTVQNRADLEVLWAETLAQDPDGEIVLLPRLTGKVSAVATAAGVTFGTGNDGATGGHHSVTIGVPTSNEAWLASATKQIVDPTYTTSGYGEPPVSVPNPFWLDTGIQSSPYVELVEDRGEMIVVQLRDGPIPPKEGNYIPHTFHAWLPILDNGCSLLEWEQRTASNEFKQDGTFYHSPGGSLASHYAVHCLLNGIPVITDAAGMGPGKWHAGKMYHSGSGGPYSIRAENANELNFQLGKLWNAPAFNEALATTKSALYHSGLIRMATATVHAMPSWGKEHLNLQAASAVLITKFLAAAILGEDRHFYSSSGPGTYTSRRHDSWQASSRDGSPERHEEFEDWLPVRDQKPAPGAGVWSSVDWNAFPRQFVKPPSRYIKNRLPRNIVYSGVLASEFSTLKEQVANALHDFRLPWRNSSFGGPKWAQVCVATLKVINDLELFGILPNADNWKSVQKSLNVALHTAHNGGMILTKWISADVLDQMEKTPQVGFLNAWAAAFVLGGDDFLQSGPKYYGEHPRVSKDDFTPEDYPYYDALGHLETETQYIYAHWPERMSIPYALTNARSELEPYYAAELSNVSTEAIEDENDYFTSRSIHRVRRGRALPNV